MALQDEINYAKRQLEVYQWLTEYRNSQNPQGQGRGWFTFGTSTLNPQNTQRGKFIFQGRGSNDKPKTSFYIEILKREGRGNYAVLSFTLNHDYSQITGIKYGVGWRVDSGAVNNNYQTFARNIPWITLTDRKGSGTIEGQNLENSLSAWLDSIQAAYSQVQGFKFDAINGPARITRLDQAGLLTNDNGDINVNENRINSPYMRAGAQNQMEQAGAADDEDDENPVEDDANEDNENTVVASENTNTTRQVLSEPFNRIIFGAPGTGKSFIMEEERKNNFGERYKRVTFYPTYSYAQFVGTYKPVMKTPAGKTEEEISYEFVPGPFLQVLVSALKEPKKNWCLVIEEINRANAAAVFGDVFQLLDRKTKVDNNGVNEIGVSEYPVDASEDVKKYLYGKLKDDESAKAFLKVVESQGIWESCSLRIPANMYIWATMNSADQGVSPLDTAFKRRWEFEYIGIDNGAKDCEAWTIDGKNYKWNDVRRVINGLLSANGVNEDKLLGAHFVKVKDNDKKISPESFASKVLMYLWEDAGRMIRRKLFGEDILTYSQLLSAWEKGGIQIFENSPKSNAVQQIYDRLITPPASPAEQAQQQEETPAAEPQA